MSAAITLLGFMPKRRHLNKPALEDSDWHILVDRDDLRCFYLYVKKSAQPNQIISLAYIPYIYTYCITMYTGVSEKHLSDHWLIS